MGSGIVGPLVIIYELEGSWQPWNQFWIVRKFIVPTTMALARSYSPEQYTELLNSQFFQYTFPGVYIYFKPKYTYFQISVSNISHVCLLSRLCLEKKPYKLLKQQNTSRSVYDRAENCNFKNVLFSSLIIKS